MIRRTASMVVHGFCCLSGCTIVYTVYKAIQGVLEYAGYVKVHRVYSRVYKAYKA